LSMCNVKEGGTVFVLELADRISNKAEVVTLDSKKTG
jgi:hypothetical protein